MTEPAIRRLGGVLPVSVVGLGCMGMSWAYHPSRRDDRRSARVIEQAVGSGVTLFDTADVYGAGANERLLGRALRGQRDRVAIATKCGLVPVPGRERPVPRGTPEHLRTAVEASLRRLGTDRIDLCYLHRVDPAVPLADSWGALAELVAAGKIRHIGLSEVRVDQLAQAHRQHPVTAVQSELSLWTRDHLAELLPWCQANRVGFVAFGALGRGFLAGSVAAVTEPGDLRSAMPRFAPAAARANQRITAAVAAVAGQLSATLAQVALAWVLAQGPQVVALAGTTRPEHLADNLGAVGLRLPPAALAALAELPAPVGDRY